MNKTIQQMTRATLDEFGKPHTLWGEESDTTINILNKTHILVNSDKNPYELWFGKPPVVKHYRFFGRKSYIKNIDDILGKFQSRLDQGILFGYKCYNKSIQNIVECIDVVIDETSTGTKREAPVDDELFPTTSQKDVGGGGLMKHQKK